MNPAIYRAFDRVALNAAYDVCAAVPDSASLLHAYESRSWLLRHQYPRFSEHCYGERDVQRIDFFSCGKSHAPLLVFIHDGYWLLRTKETFSFVANGLITRGWNVALPGCSPVSKQSLNGILEELRNAVRWLRKRAFELGSDASHIVVAGWSAGGHLASLLLDEPGVIGGLSISGIYDLEPFALSDLNATLQLTTTDIEVLSPLRLPCVDKPFLTACGSQDLSEIRRQMQEFSEYRGSLCQRDHAQEVDGHNHFTILRELESPEGKLTNLLLETFGKQRYL